MPFPNREMEHAYQYATPIVQGSFKDEPELYEANGRIQLLYMKIAGDVNGAALEDLKELISAMRTVAAYECRHCFVEGWLSAEARMPRKNRPSGRKTEEA